MMINKLKARRFCRCRTCGEKYDANTARGDYRGFCSAKCQHKKAKDLGFNKKLHRFESSVLFRAKEVGDIPWNHGRIVAVGFDTTRECYVLKFEDGDIELRNISDFRKEVGDDAYRDLQGIAAYYPDRLMKVMKDLKLTGDEVVI